MNILAIDLGFGSIKTSHFDPESKEMVLDKVISAIAKLPSAPDECDDESTFQLGENYYVLGPQALKLPKEYLMPLHDYETLKAVYPQWVSFLIHKYKKQGVTFDKIAIGLSLAYKDKAEDLLKYLSETLMVDESFFICLPQGVAAKVALQEYGLSLDPANRTAFKFDNYLLCDLGSSTIDAALILGSLSSTESSIGLEDLGVCRILYNIIDFIYKSTGVSIDRQQAKTIVETGQYKRRGRVFDLSQQVHEYVLKYFTEVIELFDINPKLSSLIDNVQRIILIGGGAEIWRQYKDEIDKILEKKGYPLNFWVLPEKNGEYFNAISYLLIANKLFNN